MAISKLALIYNYKMVKGIICSECMKEIEDERIKRDEKGEIVSYPAYCRNCENKFGWRKNQNSNNYFR